MIDALSKNITTICVQAIVNNFATLINAVRTIT